MSKQPEWTGGCLCGTIKYRATADPVRQLACHCTTCQRVSGSAFLSFVHFPKEAFEWDGPEPKFWPSTVESERGFCPDCGSQVALREEVLPDRVQVTLGSLDQRLRIKLDDHVFWRSRLPWVEFDDDTPKHALFSDAVAHPGFAKDVE